MTNPNVLKPVVLLILDGWGQAPAWGGNAISVANLPEFNKLWRSYPHTTLCASGKCVGLPGHERGNSEVGHLNLGTGRIFYQDSSRINESIEDGSFYNNPVLLKAINHAKTNNSSLHLMGLASPGGIHSHINHLYALLDLCQKQKINKVFLQLFTDGRDTAPTAALNIFANLENRLKTLGFGQIASISGRFYAMDRDNHWERTESCYKAMANGIGEANESALSAISRSYNQGVTDEFIRPVVIVKNNQPIGTIRDNDAVIFFNFRSDRARQISMAINDEKFTHFKRKGKINNLDFVGLIPYGYEEELKLHLESAFKPEEVKNCLAQVLSDHKLKQFHIAETEKYAHVTYFFNGGHETSFPGEDRLLVPSPRVASYDLKPEMSVHEISVNAVQAIKNNKYDFLVINFANADMVGHTGNFKAVIKATEAVDKEIGSISQAVLENNALLIITADHGNAEEMINPRTGEIDTEHANSPVPFILIANKEIVNNVKLRNDGILADVAPTILGFMHITRPEEMTGQTLEAKI